MKKSLIALAVLAASGAAMAQSSVTLYGIADIWFGSVKVDDGTTSTSTTRLQSGGVSSSRWGMKGSEDLGGGLKANFQLEQGFAMDSGTGANFGRQSWVGFSGGFGEVRLGNTGTAYDDVSGASNAVFDSDLAPINGADDYGQTPAVFLSTGYKGKPGNQIYYKTPSMGGLTGAVSYALAEDANGVPVGATTYTSLNVAYAAGPLGAQFGYQKEDKNNQSSDTAYLRLGATYDFGVATGKFTYGKVTNIGNVDGADASEYQFGADVPLAANMILSGSYAKSDDNAKAGDTQRSGLGLAVAYLMSKRTTLYGGVKSMKYDFIGTTPDTKINIYAVGVKHTF